MSDLKANQNNVQNNVIWLLLLSTLKRYIRWFGMVFSQSQIWMQAQTVRKFRCFPLLARADCPAITRYFNRWCLTWKPFQMLLFSALNNVSPYSCTTNWSINYAFSLNVWVLVQNICNRLGSSSGLSSLLLLPFHLSANSLVHKLLNILRQTSTFPM